MRRMIAALLGLFLALPAGAEEALKLALGQRGNWDTALEELGQQAGIFAKHGLKLEILYTKGAAESRQAVLSNSVDIGLDGTLSVFAAFSKGAPVRIVAAQMTGGADYWYALASGPIHGMKDAAGMSVAYSTQGASTNVAALALLKQAGVVGKPVATGDPAGTMVQVMTKQIDIGWSAPPFGLKEMQEGTLRLVARAVDVPSIRGQTVRVLITTQDDLARRQAALTAFVQAYRETIDWAYASDAPLHAYAAFAGVPEAVARQTRDEFFPKAMMQPDAVSGVPDLMQDAVTYKFLHEPLTAAQLAEVVRIPQR